MEPPITFASAFANRSELVEKIDALNGRLLVQLQDMIILPKWQVTDCKRSTNSETVERMLECLTRCDDTKFPEFCRALIETGQQHVVRDFFPSFRHLIPTGVAHLVQQPSLERRDNFVRRLRSELRELIDVDFGLLPELLKRRTLNYEMMTNVRDTPWLYIRVDELMNHLETLTDQQLDGFLEGLRSTYQQHVENFIKVQEGQRERDDFDDVWPLTNSHRCHIDYNYHQWNELIKLNTELIVYMQQKRCITERHAEYLMNKSSTGLNQPTLADILRRRSISDVFGAFDCVERAGNVGLANALRDAFSTKGCFVEMVCYLNGQTPENVEDLETNLVYAFLTGVREVIVKGFRWIGLIRQNGLGVYIYCQSENELVYLTELESSGQLSATLEEIFTKVTENSDVIRIKTLEWSQDDKMRCRMYFHGLNDVTMEPSGSKRSHTENSGNETDVKRTRDDITDRNKQLGTKKSLPMEVLELLLIRSYMKLFVDGLKSGIYISDVEQTAYRPLASVCRDWWQTLNGWPQSHTPHWTRHKLQRLVIYVCRPYRRRPQLVKQLDTKSEVMGVTQMDDKIFVVCKESDTIRVFGLNYLQLEDIEVKGLKDPLDIAACSETWSLYVADWSAPGCVWRVWTDGQIDKFLPTTTTTSFRPWSLSVTSSRLLVTTGDGVLLLFGADGGELKRLSFTGMFDLQHAVETPRRTFVLCHLKPQPQVVEVDGDGRIISVYNDQQQLTWPRHLSIDFEGKMCIADRDKQHILLLTSDLQLDRVLLDSEHNQLVKRPWRLFYAQQAHQFLLGGFESPVVQVFAVG